MIKRISVLFILAFLSVAIPLHAQWIQPNGPNGADVRCFAVSGSNLYAGTYGSGVFLSTNDGATWFAINSGLSNTQVYSLAISGSNLFAATYGGGVFVSTDNGTSWTAASTGLTNTQVYAIAVSGPNLFAGTSLAGVFRTTNDGASWTSVNTGLTNTFVRCLATYSDEAGSRVLIAGTSGGGVFFSNDDGATWSAASYGLTNTQVQCLAVFPNAAGGTDVFAGTANGLFRTTTIGTYWAAVSTGLTNTNILSFAVSPRGAGGTDLYAGTASGVFRSTNRGANWNDISTGLTLTTVTSLALNDTNLFAGTLIGAFRRPLTDFMSLVSPGDGQGGITPPITFKWMFNPAALAYAFQISTVANFSNTVVNQSTADTSVTVSNLQLTSSYFWRVRAENSKGTSEWGGRNLVTKMMITPQLLAPASGATSVGVTPTLSWAPVVSTASYEFQLSYNSAFDSLVYIEETAALSTGPAALKRSTTYYWRVRARTNGDTTAWSPIFNFTTIPIPPSPPKSISLIYPDSSKQDAYRNDWLTWQADPSATKYLIQISQSPLFTTIYDSSTVNGAGYRNTNRSFTPGSTYFWRVRGSNSSGDGSFSSVWSFRVGSVARTPAISYSAATLDYGRVEIGQFKDTTLGVSNTGTDTLRLQSISSSSGLISVRAFSGVIAPGQLSTDSIRFAPTAIGMAACTLIVRSNSSTGTDTIRVSGFGFGQAVATLYTTNMMIGRVKVGQYKDTSIAIRNTGTDTLKIASILTSNPVFVVQTTSRALPPSQSFADTLRFTPGTVGTANGSIVVISDSPSSPDTIKLSGFGYGQAGLSASAEVISFGNVKVGQHRDSVLAISNTGNDTLKISTISSSSIAFRALQISAMIPAGKSLFVDTIRFAPMVGGNISANIILSSNAPTSPDSIEVSGFGLSPGLRLSTSRIDLGMVLLGGLKDTTFNIANTGSDTLKIIWVSGSPQVITIRPTTFNILPSGVVTDTIRFTPTVIGSVSGSIIVLSNAASSPDSISIRAIGVTAATDVTREEGIPKDYALSQNYPNPFNPSTTIRYSLPKTAFTLLRIFNTLGQEISILVNERKDAGSYRVQWNANVPSGIYFYRLQAGEYVETKKMILLK